MKFRLTAPHYILDRYLDAETLITPTGFQEVFGDGKPNERGELTYGLEQAWTTIDGKETRTWKGPPSMMMAPVDKEAEKAFEAHFTSRPTSGPIENLSLKVA